MYPVLDVSLTTWLFSYQQSTEIEGSAGVQEGVQYSRSVQSDACMREIYFAFSGLINQ